MLGLLGVCLSGPTRAEETPFITLASTTSTRDSGLFASILPAFEAATNISVRVVAVGTGQALALARRGDADVLLVHDRASEDAFLAEGYATLRRDVMYNDFVLVGPTEDRAGVRGSETVAVALARIAAQKGAFVSRGDDSGTHKAELRLWKSAGLDPREASGAWYREIGDGMGATLNVANELPAYTLADRATWNAFKNRGALDIVIEGDPPLRNPYGVLLVNPARHPHVKHELGLRFVDWLTGEEGHAAIEAFRIHDAPAFFLIPPAQEK
jgi:tungstate transport system substrate-binding protein